MLSLHRDSAATRTAPSSIFQHATCRAPPDKELNRKTFKGKRVEQPVRRILFHSLPHSHFLTKDCFPLLLTFSAIFSKGKRGTTTLFLLALNYKKHFRLVHNAELKGEPRSGESSEQRERL
jgi:hypothetical protein